MEDTLWFAQNAAGEYAIGMGDREIGIIGSLEDARKIKHAFNTQAVLLDALKIIAQNDPLGDKQTPGRHSIMNKHARNITLARNVVAAIKEA